MKIFNFKITQIIGKSERSNIIIIIPETEDKTNHMHFWLKNEITANKNIIIMYVDEYKKSIQPIDGDLIICGWLGEKKMKYLIYKNTVENIYILLNRVENTWKNIKFKQWKGIIRSVSRKTFDKILTNIDIKEDIVENEEYVNNMDIEFIEKSILENRFKKYSSLNTSDKKMIEVESIPIIFVKNYFSLYRISSRIITVTELIINNDSDSNYKIKYPDELETGDFVVIRESDKSLIRELADTILEEESKQEYRQISQSWKTSLNKMREDVSVKKIHELVRKEGSKITSAAFRNWIDDDDFIAPQDKENLLYIAAALNDSYLLNNIDDIFNKCKYVRSKHVQAGKILSGKLKNEIAVELNKMKIEDRGNIYEPIDLHLENIGNIKILKVINISTGILVNRLYTNRLLTETNNEFIPENY
jgi:hypothetical protein